MLDKYFHLKEAQTTVKTEILAGFTTFMTMSYIIFVNPSLLSAAGIDYGAAFVATCLAAAIGTLLMGLWANYPIALAPGMGMNAYFTYGVVLGLGVSWQVGLAIVFYSGLIFFLISLFKIRDWVVNAIPDCLKKAIGAGIGLFLLVIGLQNAGIIVDHPATLITLGDMTAPTVLMTLLGFLLIFTLSHKKITGAILISIIGVSVLGSLLGLNKWEGIISQPPSILPTLMQLDFSAALDITLISVIFAFLFIDMFDSVGTFIGVTRGTKLIDKNGKLKNIKQAFLSDSTATMAGAFLGTSPTTSYIESATGIRTGGRTGLTAVIVALLFVLALFFAPLAKSVPSFATAAALMYVAFLMLKSLQSINWEDISEYVPVLITCLFMPLTYSIATGIGFGFISYVCIKFLLGRGRDISFLTLAVAILFVLRFAFGQG